MRCVGIVVRLDSNHSLENRTVFQTQIDFNVCDTLGVSNTWQEFVLVNTDSVGL